MATKIGTNPTLSLNLKRDAIHLLSNLGMNLSTAVSVSLRDLTKVLADD